MLRRHGIDVQGYRRRHDARELRAQCRRPAATTWIRWRERYLGYDTIRYEDVAGKGAKQITVRRRSRSTKPPRYAAEDADITLRLHQVLSPKLAAEPSLQRVYREIEMPLVPVLERMEANGVMIDMDELRRQSADLSQRMLQAQQQRASSWPGARSTWIRRSSWARCCSMN